jgi:glycosyltransferase involved in cell wall biosynthesis
MNQRPIVDVFVTVYDRHEYLEQCLKSASAQTLDGARIIVLDDGGLSQTEEIMNRFCDQRIRLRKNKVRLGVARSVFSAISLSDAKYCAILNDDDWWDSKFLSSLVGALEENPSAGLAFCDHWIVNEQGRVDKDATAMNSRLYREQLQNGVLNNLDELVVLHNSVPMAMGTVFRRSAVPIKYLLPNVGTAYDYWLSLVISQFERRAIYDSNRYSFYRIHDRMETANRAADSYDSGYWVHRNLLKLGFHSQFRSKIRRKKFQYGLRAIAAKVETGDVLSFGRFVSGHRRWSNLTKPI